MLYNDSSMGDAKTESCFQRYVIISWIYELCGSHLLISKATNDEQGTLTCVWSSGVWCRCCRRHRSVATTVIIHGVLFFLISFVSPFARCFRTNNSSIWLKASMRASEREEWRERERGGERLQPAELCDVNVVLLVLRAMQCAGSLVIYFLR